jgi:hypothetical protein
MKRIKYISKFNKEMAVEEIRQLVDKSARNNSEKGITGIFMAAGKLFFQIIEGPDDEINQLWNSIQNDSRHTDIVILKIETGFFERIFPDWSMKSLVIDADSEMRLDPLQAILEMITEWEKRKIHLINTLELAIFSELSRIEKNMAER